MLLTSVLCFLLVTPAVAQEPAHDHAGPARIAAISAALGLKPGSTIADVGSGAGDYTVKLAKAVGAGGRVYAVDISGPALARLRTRVAAEGLTNVEAVEGAIDNPRLPAGAIDAALIVNAFHEMTEARAMLAGIRAALKPGGRLVIIEPLDPVLRGLSRADQTRRHNIAPELVLREIREAGFDIVALEDPFKTEAGHDGHWEWLLIAVPSSQAPGSNR